LGTLGLKLKTLVDRRAYLARCESVQEDEVQVGVGVGQARLAGMEDETKEETYFQNHFYFICEFLLCF